MTLIRISAPTITTMKDRSMLTAPEPTGGMTRRTGAISGSVIRTRTELIRCAAEP